MKVGILTYHRALNYGAFLQAVCLCKRLNAEKDISAEIIDYDMLSAQNMYKQLIGNTVKKQIKYLANDYPQLTDQKFGRIPENVYLYTRF